MNKNIQILKEQVTDIVQRGATQYKVIDGVRRLYFPDGKVALNLPSAATDPDSLVATHALEQISMREYKEYEGKVVLVNWLSGYDESDCSRDIFVEPPTRVRVCRNIDPNDVFRWMDSNYIDPVWDVELIDKTEPALAGMRSFWVFATSRSLSGVIGKGDVVAVESFMARVRRALGFTGPFIGSKPENNSFRI